MKLKLTLFIGLLLILVFLLFPNKETTTKPSQQVVPDLTSQENLAPTEQVTDDEDVNSSEIEEEEVDYLKDTTFENEEGRLVVTNPDDILVLVNKDRSLASDYIPEDLVIPNVRFSFEEDVPKKYLRKEAAEALEDLFEIGDKEDIYLFGISGYRSYNRQKTLFDNKANQVGAEKANLIVAFPGESEHQTGLTIDVSSQSAQFKLVESFEDTPEGQWLKDNAHRAGFIIRYEKDTTDITGYSYEPWHIRYVGVDIAREIYDQGLTLEEFLGAMND